MRERKKRRWDLFRYSLGEHSRTCGSHCPTFCVARTATRFHPCGTRRKPFTIAPQLFYADYAAIRELHHDSFIRITP
ncbi:hypothetical protein RSAG8_08195, partial [Rhizoctonia solani AG-8 WAC10335]